MAKRRFLTFGLGSVFVVVFLCACGIAVWKKYFGPAANELSAEEHAIVSLAIAHCVWKQDEPGYSVIVSTTVENSIVAEEVSFLGTVGEELDERVVVAVKGQTKPTGVLAAKLDPNFSYKLVAKEAMDKIFRESDPDVGWGRFYKSYPEAKNRIKISRPAIDTNGKNAIVYVECGRESLVAEAGLAVLEFKNGKWKLAGIIPLWAS